MSFKFKYSLWVFFITVSMSFIACSKDEESVVIEEEEVNYPIYVSEAEQGDYKNVYSYERVNDKIRLKQIDLYKFGFKKYDLKMKYDEQNRLIQCKRSVLLSDSKYHENVILNDLLPSDYTIQYGTNKLTVTDNDDISNTRVYSMGSDGCVNDVSWSVGNQLHMMNFKRSGNSFVSMDYTLSEGDNSTIQKSLYDYDDKNSVDYLRVMLPCLFSEHNILRTTVSDDNHEISKTTYAYTYRTYNYPVIMVKNEITYNGRQEVSHRTTTNLKYINADRI